MKRATSATSAKNGRPLPLGLPALLAASLLVSVAAGLATGDVELAAALVAVAATGLVAVGVWHLRLLSVCAGAGLFAAALLAVGLSSDVRWKSERVLLLRVVVVDADSRAPIGDAAVQISRRDAAPDSPVFHTDSDGRAVAAVIAPVEGQGPLWRQLAEPEPKPELRDYVLTVSAPDYEPFESPLQTQLPYGVGATPGAELPALSIALKRR